MKLKLGDLVVYKSNFQPYHYLCSFISSIKEVYSSDGRYKSHYRLYKLEDVKMRDFRESDIIPFKKWVKEMKRKELTPQKYVEWVNKMLVDRVKSKEGY